VSANDIWAVGDFSVSSIYQTLAEHWNGTSWSIVSSPNIGTNSDRFLGVSAVSANDVWAVGTYSTDGTNFLTLTQHWNGSAWSVVASPNPSTVRNILNAVAAVATNDVWAVGNYNTTMHTLTEHEHSTKRNVAGNPVCTSPHS